MVFGRKNKQSQADAIMDAVLKATGETDLTADPTAPAKVVKRKLAAIAKSKSKPISDNLFIVHAEKIALTIAMLLSGYLIYAGMGAGVNDQGKGFTKTREDLDTRITEANNEITDGSWEQEQDTYSEDLVTSYENQAKNSQITINSDDYSPNHLFNPPSNRIITRREDPQLYPVMDIRTVALTGPVAYILGENDIDPTADDKPAQEVIETKRPIRKSSKNETKTPFGGGAMDGMGGMDGMDGMMGGMDGMMGGDENSTRPIRKLRSDRGQILGYRPTGGNSGAMGGMESGGMESGGMESGGMESGGMESGGMESGGTSGLTKNKPMGTPVARSRTMVAGTALVPFKQQFDEFERALAMRSGYDGLRDQPDYVFMYVERVDVTSDPTQVVDENQWQKIMHTKAWRNEQKKWHSTATEIVSSSYLNPYISLQCPPVMIRNLDDLLRHPLIPLAGMTTKKSTDNEAVEETQEEPEENSENADLPGGLANNQPNENTNSDGALGGMDGMMGGTGGMDGMMGGMGGMDGMMGGAGISNNIPDYKLVRFYDFSAEIGHVYRYRVKLFIEDPNHPNTKSDDEYRDHPVPTQVTLKDDVIQRIKQLDDSLIFWRETPWSEPSEPIAVLNLLQFAAGTTAVVKTSRDPISKQLFQDHEPSGVVKAIIWDERRAVDIMFDRPVHRGSLMNFSVNAEYGHPITETIMAAERHQFETDFIIGDIRGGDALPLDTKDFPYHAPGEFLLIDAQGNLVVHTELANDRLFRRYNYTSDTEDRSAPTDGGMTEMMNGGGGALPGIGGGN
jgi:hypothetical protein